MKTEYLSHTRHIMIRGDKMANEKELQSLLNTMAQRLGTTPDQMKAEAQSGDLSRLFGAMNPEDAAKIQKVLNDREAANKLLNSPQAQQLIRQLMGGQNTQGGGNR